MQFDCITTVTMHGSQVLLPLYRGTAVAANYVNLQQAWAIVRA